MAKKKNVEKAPRQYTRRQLSNIQRQKRRQNFILYGGIGIIAAVVIIILVGIYIGEIRPYQKTAMKVYDREFNVRYYMDAGRYGIELYPPEYRSQVISSVVQSLPNVIQKAELIRRSAEELEITVDDDDVKENFKETDFTITDASIDIARTELLRERLLEEYFSQQIPESADQVNIQAMFLESELKVDEIKGMLDAGDNFTELAANYSAQYYTKDVTSDFGWRIEDWLENRLESNIPFDYSFNAEPGTLSDALYDPDLEKQLGYWLVNVLERDDTEHAHVQAMLLGSEQEAEVIKQRFLDGEDFGELAKQFSQDEGSREAGGDLGVTVNGSRTTAFDTEVFALDAIETGLIGPFIDESVTTMGGYWLINVIDKQADRPLRDEDRSFLENNVYDDWVEQLFEDSADFVDSSYLSLDDINWIMEELREELL